MARGGTAEVWRARDERDGRRVAVKLLHPHLLPDQASRTRLASEARAVAGLDHPGIIRVLAADAGERPAVVLELVEGESLSARVARDGRLDTRTAVGITAELAEALYHAHTRGVIHRDVKPGNILIGTDGHARLVDFGIARLLGEAVERTTQTGMVMGTLRYMAPEQLAGEQVGPKVDLYGLGAVFHEMLTGQPPHAATSPVALLTELTAGPPRMEGIDPALASVVAACLRPRPEERPRHAGDVAIALRAWLAGDPTPALALAPRTALASPPSGSADAVTQAMPALGVSAPEVIDGPPPSARRRAGALILFVLAALVLVATVAVGLSVMPRLAVAEPNPISTPISTPLPAWAAELADRQQSACGTAPTPAELAAMGQAAATHAVESAVAGCSRGSGGGGKDGGHGHGKH